MTTERTQSNPSPEPRKEPIDRERQKNSDHADVEERGPDTGGGKLIPGDNR